MVHSEEELKMLVTASQEAGVLEEQEEQMLHRVFGFADLTAGQVMVPRTELVGRRRRAPPATMLLELIARDRLSDAAGLPGRSRQRHRHPARRSTSSRRSPPGRRDVDAGALAREALTVPETLGADDLLAAMQPARRARGHRHRRVRRHRRPGDVRIADGADRRRPRREQRRRADRDAAETDRLKSTA